MEGRSSDPLGEDFRASGGISFGMGDPIPVWYPLPISGLFGEDLMWGEVPSSASEPSVVKSIPFSRQSCLRRNRLRLLGSLGAPASPADCARVRVLPVEGTVSVDEDDEGGGCWWACGAGVEDPPPAPEELGTWSPRLSSWLWLML